LKKPVRVTSGDAAAAPGRRRARAAAASGMPPAREVMTRSARRCRAYARSAAACWAVCMYSREVARPVASITGVVRAAGSGARAPGGGGGGGGGRAEQPAPRRGGGGGERREAGDPQHRRRRGGAGGARPVERQRGDQRERHRARQREHAEG